MHTPDSLTHPYRRGGRDPWDAFITGLANLPQEFKVIGINDYIFVDGYRKVLAAKANGRLPNIDLFLPVIEVRLNQFGGTTGSLSKANYHIIFSDEVPPDVIQGQFIAALGNRFELSPEYAELRTVWNALPTRESLTDLGEKIIASVPEARRHQFGSPLTEGFNNLTFSIDAINDALRNHYFERKYVTAIGKTEWADIRWNDHSIASKKHLINDAHIVFVAAESPAAWRAARESLLGAHVNAQLLDCSDAHDFADAVAKDRLGNCFTWIKADTTFEGLKQAIIEYPDRVFVGEMPEKLRRVERHSTKFIRSLEVRKVPESTLEEDWFDCEIELNTDLVAVVGNKGSGKSALLDVVGLLGNTHQGEFFSFLNKERFRQPRNNKASHFAATITWESGDKKRRRLDESVSVAEVEAVKYIPQSFLETICNEAPDTGRSAFDAELKAVIFSHVADADRLSLDSLDSLLDYKTEQIAGALDLLRGELDAVNEDIVDLEGQGTSDYRERVENLLAAKLAELTAHESARPAAVVAPEEDEEEKGKAAATSARLADAKAHAEAATREINSLAERQRVAARGVAAADRILGKLDNFRRYVETFKADLATDLGVLGISADALIRVDVETGIVQRQRTAAESERRTVDDLLREDAPNGPAERRRAAEGEVAALQQALNEPRRRYEEYRTAEREWEAQRAALVGDSVTAGSVRYYEAMRAALEELPGRLATKYAERKELVRRLHSGVAKIADAYRDLYRPVQEFIDRHAIAKEKLQLKFEVSISVGDFASSFLDIINQRVIGSFSGVDEGRRVLQSLIEKQDFNQEEDVVLFVDELMEHLTQDRRPGGGASIAIASQLRSGRTLQQLYRILFGLEYLLPRYVLRLGGKELHELSPGERGSLLLIFYLLVDKDDMPLLIDQPEENLDNQTVYELLVPCLKEAKGRRQILIVTHNPNLAVVCDAEQIVYAAHNKAEKNRVSYLSGAIENPEINRKSIDVLEGTRPAFRRRELKYF